MKSSIPKGFRAVHLLVIGLAAAALGWGINEVAVWQLERAAPEPKPAQARPEPPAFAEHSAQPIEAIDDDLIVAEPPVAEPSADPEDQPAAEAPAPAPKPTPRKAAKARSEAAPSTTPSPAAHVYRLDRDRLKERFKQPEDVAGHGHLLPNVVDGQRRGMKFGGVAPGGIFARLGIQNSDVILSVNGRKVSTHQKALSDLEKMREMSIFNVVLERDGQTRRHRYVFK